MHQLLLHGAMRQPDKTAFRWVDRNTELTYSEAVEQMERFSGALHYLGIAKRERVTIFAHNSLDYLIAMFACWRIGAIASLVPVQFADDLEYYLDDHQPSVVIYTQEQAEQVSRAAAQVRSVRHLVCMEGAQIGSESLPALLAAGFPTPIDPGNELAITHLSYTAGTSGRPKGVCLMHEPTMKAANCIAERLQLTLEDSSFGATPLSGTYQLVGNLLPFLHRMGTVNIMSNWTPKLGWKAIEDTKATVLVANPLVLSDVMEEAKIRGKIPGALRMGISGGGPVARYFKRSWRDEMAIPLIESYGQSELGGFAALGCPQVEPERRFGAIGPAQPDKEVKIMDAAGKEVPVGQVGEICLRGGFMYGYWGKADKTAEALRGEWLHTGDAGWVDNEGYITVRGRLDEVITVANKTWFPRDIEEAIAEIPGVNYTAVVGIPDARFGQRPIAYVVLQQSRVDLAAMKAAIKEKVDYDISPLSIQKIAELPKTPNGNIAKAQLRALAIRNHKLAVVSENN